jgi:uncharacterized OsmC-like protein
MNTLNEYLDQKRDVIIAREARIASGAGAAVILTAHVSAAGRSGVRRIRIRDFQVLSDSDPKFAGYDLGPTSPELQLGVLGSCLIHTFLIEAAKLQVPLDSLELEVIGTVDPRAGSPGFESVPAYPHNIHYAVSIESPAAKAEINALKEAAERNCMILNMLRQPQSISGELLLTRPSASNLQASSGLP